MSIKHTRTDKWHFKDSFLETFWRPARRIQLIKVNEIYVLAQIWVKGNSISYTHFNFNFKILTIESTTTLLCADNMCRTDLTASLFFNITILLL